jgi:hypothetical protein
MNVQSTLKQLGVEVKDQKHFFLTTFLNAVTGLVGGQSFVNLYNLNASQKGSDDALFQMVIEEAFIVARKSMDSLGFENFDPKELPEKSEAFSTIYPSILESLMNGALQVIKIQEKKGGSRLDGFSLSDEFVKNASGLSKAVTEFLYGKFDPRLAEKVIAKVPAQEAVPKPSCPEHPAEMP